MLNDDVLCPYCRTGQYTEDAAETTEKHYVECERCGRWFWRPAPSEDGDSD